MKPKQLLILCTFGALTAILVSNCRRNDIGFTNSSKAKTKDLTDASKPMNMSLGRLYYKMYVKDHGDKVTDAQVVGDNRPNRKYTYWKKGYTSESDRYSFVEVPLLYNRRSTVVTKPSNIQGNKTQEDKIAKASFDRLLIYKNKKTANVNLRILTYTPDYDYLQRHHNDISHNQINRLDKDYSGRIDFKNWAGKVLFSFKYKDGKLLGRYLSKSAIRPSSAPRTETQECDMVTTYTYIETCYYADPEGLTEWCEYDLIDVSYERECWGDEGDPEDYDTGCNCYHTNESTGPPEVINNLVDPCLNSAVQVLGGEQLPNLISAMYAITFGSNSHSSYNLYIRENTTEAPTYAAYSNSSGNNHYIYLNPNYFDNVYGQHIPGTQEFWGMTLAHEVIHHFFDINGVEYNQVLHHQTMVMEWVGALSSFLQQGYGMSLEDARALALRGMGDVLVQGGVASPQWDTFVRDHYGMSVQDVLNFSTPYVTGTKGSACP